MSGTINVKGANVLAGALQGPAATLYASSGTLSLRDPVSDAVVQNLYISGTLTGPGNIRVCGIMTWQAGTMSGTGTTEICPGAIGQINPPTGSLTLDRRELDVYGTGSWTSGCLDGYNGATVRITGTWNPNSECPGGMRTHGADLLVPLILNRGSIIKSQGTGTSSIAWSALNDGPVSAPSGGRIVFNDADGDDVSGDAEPPPLTTPDGRELADHAVERVQDRDIPLDDIDDVVGRSGDLIDRIEERDRNVYYDYELNLTVVTAEGDNVIVTAHYGYPGDSA